MVAALAFVAGHMIRISTVSINMLFQTLWDQLAHFFWGGRSV